MPSISTPGTRISTLLAPSASKMASFAITRHGWTPPELPSDPPPPVAIKDRGSNPSSRLAAFERDCSTAPKPREAGELGSVRRLNASSG